MTGIEEQAEVRTRARPMAPDERRAMIARESVPLFLEHGASLTTRQLAERLGIAEGTIFRAFGDKEALVRAAVQSFFDEGRARLAAGLVDPALPLEEKVTVLVRGTRAWMRNVFRMLSLIDRDEVPQYLSRPGADGYRTAIAALFAPNAAELTIPPDRLGTILRIAAMASHAAHLDEDGELSEAELVQFVLHGIAGGAREKGV